MSHYSNFEDCIDIFAPGQVVIPHLNDDFPYEYIDIGTSFSTPIVAGVAATIMSEHSEIKFDNELMRKNFIDMSIKDAIVKAEKITIFFENNNLDPFDKENNTPNHFINNGKCSVYISNEVSCGCPLGIKCYDDGCCSKDGKCIPYYNGFLKQRLIENGCQSEFGQCFTMEYAIEECENELKEFKECQMGIEFKSDFDSNLFDENILNSCKIFNTKKCREFYYNKISNEYVCSVVKKIKSFGFIDHFDSKMYNDYDNGSNNILNYHKDECSKSLPNDYYYCLTDEFYKEETDYKIEEI